MNKNLHNLQILRIMKALILLSLYFFIEGDRFTLFHKIFFGQIIIEFYI